MKEKILLLQVYKVNCTMASVLQLLLLIIIWASLT